MKFRRFLLPNAGVLAAVGALSSPSFGQTAAQPTTAPADSGGLEEIIVTAQRRAENIQSVPVSVTALDGQNLIARGLNDLTQIGLAAPSLQVTNYNNFAVRGIGTLVVSSAVDTSVATALDDVNLGRTYLNAVPFYDLAQVEVLNGPQGLLFGKNASAGLMNITTTVPQLKQFEASFDTEMDSRPRPDSGTLGGLGDVSRVMLNVPVTDDSALRIAGLYSYQQPVTRFVGPTDPGSDFDLEQYGVRVKYLWEAPDDNNRLYLIADYNVSNGVAGFLDETFRSVGHGSPEAPLLESIGIQPAPNNFLTSGYAPYFRNLETGGGQGTFSHTFGNGMMLSDIAAWKYYRLNTGNDATWAPADGLGYVDRQSYDQYTDEIRLTLPEANRFSGQFGLYYFYSTIHETSALQGNDFLPSFVLPTFPFCVGATPTAGGPPNCPVDNVAFLGYESDSVLHDQSYAAFGQVSYSILDALKMVVGGRETRDRLSIDLGTQTPYFVPFLAAGTFNQRYSDSNFSFKAGPQYQVTPDIMAYANYGQGYKGPGFNTSPTTTTASLAVRPETTKGFEVGAKSQFFDRRLTVNGDLFYTKFYDYQAQAFNIPTQSYITANAASLLSKGIELAVVARPIRSLTLNSQTSLLDTRFLNYPGAQCYVGQAIPSCAVNGTFNARGLTAPLAPTLTTSFEATYERELSGGVTGFLEGNFYHRSSIYFVPNHVPGAMEGPLNIIGASAGVRAGDWTLAAFCKNCTNKVYPVNINQDANDANSKVLSYTQQFDFNSVRTVGLKASYRF